MTIRINSREYHKDIDKLAKQLIKEIQLTPVDGILFLNILKKTTKEKVAEIQAHMEFLSTKLNRNDIEVVVIADNGTEFKN